MSIGTAWRPGRGAGTRRVARGPCGARARGWFVLLAHMNEQ
ncbi:hypothetical protein T261_2248 [Streptomyces lydicus]|nr:hypothetical protein T261_2248 [Streptomyces lydicus]